MVWRSLQDVFLGVNMKVMTSITDLVKNAVSSACSSNLGIRVNAPAATLHVGGDAIVEEQLRVKNYVSSSGLRISPYACGPYTTTPSITRFADVDDTKVGLELNRNLGTWCSNAISDVRVQQNNMQIPDLSLYVTRDEVDAIVKSAVAKALAEKTNDFITTEDADERYVHESTLKLYPTIVQLQGAFARKAALSNYATHEELARIGLDLRRCA